MRLGQQTMHDAAAGLGRTQSEEPVALNLRAIPAAVLAAPITAPVVAEPTTSPGKAKLSTFCFRDQPDVQPLRDHDAASKPYGADYDYADAFANWTWRR